MTSNDIVLSVFDDVIDKPLAALRNGQPRSPIEDGQPMKWISQASIALVALLHIYIAWFEIFAWTEVGRTFSLPFDPEIFAETADIAANQGVYNLFLAVGLVWSLVIREMSHALPPDSSKRICAADIQGGVSGIALASTA